MLEILKNKLTEEELEFLRNCINNFSPTDTPRKDDNSQNYYIRQHLPLEQKLLNFVPSILKIAKEKLTTEYYFQGGWINKVDSSVNQNDDFHLDESDLTVVTYLNEDFEGGEFEYIVDKDVKTIRPEVNLSLLMNNKLSHRVLPVKNGVRYSLVLFFKYVGKKTSTFI